MAERTPKDIFVALRDPFPAHEIEWRVGQASVKSQKGLALAYLTARACMDRLDDVLGPENWQDEYRKEGSATFCRLSIRIPGSGEWLSHEDASDESDIEAVKGGVSGAFKRACVKPGIGRYLYHLPDVWVPVKEKYRTKAGKIVWGIIRPPALESWALPGGSGHPPTPGQRPAPQAAERGATGESPSLAYMDFKEAIDAAVADKNRDEWKRLKEAVPAAYKAKELPQSETIELQKYMTDLTKKKKS